MSSLPWPPWAGCLFSLLPPSPVHNLVFLILYHLDLKWSVDSAASSTRLFTLQGSLFRIASRCLAQSLTQCQCPIYTDNIALVYPVGSSVTKSSSFKPSSTKLILCDWKSSNTYEKPIFHYYIISSVQFSFSFFVFHRVGLWEILLNKGFVLEMCYSP